VTIEEFKTYLTRNTGTELAEISPEAAGPLLDQYVDEVLLSEFAAANSLEVTADKVAAAVREDAGSTIDSKRDELRRAALVTSISESVPAPGESEIQAYYDQHPDDFRIPEEVSLRQILVRDAETAAAVIGKLKTGGDFAELSKEYSKAPNADRGGEIGFVSRGQLPKIFEDVIFTLEPGEFSQVVEADANFHIFFVEEHAPTRTIPLAEVRSLIRLKLQTDETDRRVRETLENARQTFPVTILTRRLPFTYTGDYPVSENE
jgi:parvulin-like peptidyl-prolyl isomerase